MCELSNVFGWSYRWMILHNIYSPFRDQDIDRMVLVSQYAMLVMAMVASTNQIDTDAPIMYIVTFFSLYVFITFRKNNCVICLFACIESYFASTGQQQEY